MDVKGKKSSRPSGIPRTSRLPVASSLPKPRVPASPRILAASGTELLFPKDDGTEFAHLPPDVDNISYSAPQNTQSVSVRAMAKPSEPTPKHRKPRPSLSDRTVETLNQIPPSPSPRRRNASFFNAESPMAPPIRPDTSIGRRRPSTSYDCVPILPVTHRVSRPASPTKLFIRPPMAPKGSKKSPSKRSVSAIQQSMPPPSHRRPNVLMDTKARAHSRLDASNGSEQRKGSMGSSSDKYSNASLKSKAPPSYTTQKKHINDSTTNKASATKTDHMSPTTADSIWLNSSAALRETIARAKAAHRTACAGQKIAPSKEFKLEDAFPAIDAGGSDMSVVKKRVAAARREGRLNIAAMGLKSLPPELLEMYDSSAMALDDGTWAENVDLIKLVAADNSFESLDDRFFPSNDPDNDGPQDSGSHVLESLETLDLHGNQLLGLPMGLRHLRQLTILNLSRNQLQDSSLSPIGNLQALRDLRLAENKLKSIAMPELFHLPSLEILDLSRNSISAIPAMITELSNLRILNMSGNKLTTLPEGVFSSMHLRELNISRTNLKGCLLPPNAYQNLSALRILDVSFNALTSISPDPVLALPCLQSLILSENRLKTVPDLSGSPSLITLVADGNQMTDVPPGLVTLSSLKDVDLSRNDLRQVDLRFGFMQNLTFLSVANNPIRERRLLEINTEDLKRELREKQNKADVVEPEGQDSMDGIMNVDESQVNKVGDVQPGGVLDMSSAKLGSIDKAILQDRASVTAIKSLILKRNLLSTIAPALELVAETLVTLDLSNNRLGGCDYLTGGLDLPKLKALDLSANAIWSLTPLLSHLSAGALSELNISRNRLTSLPILRSSYPSLTTVLASDNSISDLSFESIQGLQVLDVSSNEISHLQPRFGLLAREGLRVFLVGANTFRVPRRDVVEKGTEAILTWLRGRIPDD